MKLSSGLLHAHAISQTSCVAVYCVCLELSCVRGRDRQNSTWTCAVFPLLSFSPRLLKIRESPFVKRGGSWDDLAFTGALDNYRLVNNFASQISVLCSAFYLSVFHFIERLSFKFVAYLLDIFQFCAVLFISRFSPFIELCYPSLLCLPRKYRFCAVLFIPRFLVIARLLYSSLLRACHTKSVLCSAVFSASVSPLGCTFVLQVCYALTTQKYQFSAVLFIPQFAPFIAGL